MNLFKRILGCIILALIFAGLFAVTCVQTGVLTALVIWGIAAGVTALVVLAAYLIHSDE